MSPSLQQTAASNENKTLKQPWRNKQSVDIWRWCHTPFESYRPQLRDDNGNIRFMFHFLVRETHKAVCAIRDCKKKTQISRREKNEEIISRKCQPHHKKVSTFLNTHVAVWLQFLSLFLRYSRMSKTVQQAGTALHSTTGEISVMWAGPVTPCWRVNVVKLVDFTT
jgi:hypothetical protein